MHDDNVTPSPRSDSSEKAESLYSYLFDVSPFPAVVSRLRDHTVLAVNARTSEVIGIAQREAVGQSVSDY